MHGTRHRHGWVSDPDSEGIPTPARSGPDSADGQVFGVLLLLLGGGWLVRQTGVVDMSWETLLSALLIVLGVGLVITARRGGRGGLLIVGFVLVCILASTSSLDLALLKGGIGQRVERPLTAASLDRYVLGIGELIVDLRSMDLDEGETASVRATVGVGHLVVQVPRDVALSVRADTAIGEAVALGSELGSGIGQEKRFIDDDYATAERKLSLRLTAGIGSIEVVHAGS